MSATVITDGSVASASTYVSPLELTQLYDKNGIPRSVYVEGISAEGCRQALRANGASRFLNVGSPYYDARVPVLLLRAYRSCGTNEHR